jgi:hypothetical protein
MNTVGPPWWDDKPVYLVGGGPSLKGFQFDLLAGLHAHIVGVNQSMLDAPVCAGLSTDWQFQRARVAELTELAKRIELFLTADAPDQSVPVIPGAIYLTRHISGGLSTDPSVIRTVGSSGYAAINLAVLKRARRLVLLGYDYNINGAHHYHSAYPWYKPIAHGPSWGYWAGNYEAIMPDLDALGVQVFNASPDSAITCFEKITIEQALLLE